MDFSDPYNLIHCTVSFLSRSTQESGLSQEEKKEEKKRGEKRRKNLKLEK
ncbi:hypothetical protein [Methanosarcina sp. 2.H.T.1A.6]|nr:hypothetical protein [Methanosarcina sp. 2.H.T.1A.6]